MQIDEAAIFLTAKDYLSRVTNDHTLPERSDLKTKCMERYGLDTLADRGLVTIIGMGITKGAQDFEMAASLGSVEYNMWLRKKAKEQKVQLCVK